MALFCTMQAGSLPYSFQSVAWTYTRPLMTQWEHMVNESDSRGSKPTNKGLSRSRHLQGKECNHWLSRTSLEFFFSLIYNTYIHLHIHTFTYTYIYIYINLHIHTFTYTYIYIYIYIHIHTHTHIFIYIYESMHKTITGIVSQTWPTFGMRPRSIISSGLL